ncbi:uncharacterized protein CTRU02_209342 [Colletotrichum truncatum]|uniref:Uncharacterized protein n=1 Tax=Colletotrichum truncatum TaxID=5467 RepID=A0ACC3YSA7_COLTU|nr:uncharacterized protein CTRU02_08584 [Colletotrichum truncatum]KAF6789885.1 hypothetical protein CTRU02_08584 [Colletotrichum truncatum]
MDSAYWDIFPDAGESESSEEEVSTDDDDSCTPGLEVPCRRCKHRNRLCKRCTRRRQQLSKDLSRRSSLELACFPETATTSANFTAADADVAAPVVPEAYKNGVPMSTSPVYASMYTASPSWMSTYTSSTGATTHTGTHERSRREGDLLDVTGRRRPHPRRPRTQRTGGTAEQARRDRMELEGWDERDIDGGSYWAVDGARWEEQRVLQPPPTPRHRAQQNAWKRRSRFEERWKGRYAYVQAKEVPRSLPLVDPPRPRYTYDVLSSSSSRLWTMAFTSGKGHTRVVYTMTYARGTGHVRGFLGLLVPKGDAAGDVLGFGWILRGMTEWAVSLIGPRRVGIGDLDRVD